MLKSLLLRALILSSQGKALGQASFADTVATYFREVKVATEENKDLWNYDTYGPILLVKPDTREVFANFPDSAGTLRKVGTIFTGKLPDSITIANT